MSLRPLGQHPVNCTDVADVHVRGKADLVDVCLYTQPAVPQHSQDACDRSDRDLSPPIYWTSSIYILSYSQGAKRFESYLPGRLQYVCLKSACSGPKTVNCGVPQGFVLGSLLFLPFNK